MHGPLSEGSVHNSWKLKMFLFFHGLHIYQTCHMFGMLWINVYDTMFRFPTISSNFTQPLKEESDNIPHDTINSLIKSM
jgi:hypothetical protein